MLDLPNISLAITALINAGLVFFVYGRNKKSPVNISFALFVLFLSFWALVILQFRLTTSEFTALYLLKGSYISAALIAACFYYFSLAFPGDKRPDRFDSSLIIFNTLVLCLLILFPHFLTKHVVYHDWGKEVILGLYEYLLFAAVFIYFFVGGQVRIWLKFLKARGMERIQLLYIGLSVTVIGLIGMYYNLLLPSPFYQDFRYVWTGPIFTFFFAIVITYSIFRYRLFNIKAIFAELLVFSLWVFIFIRTLLSTQLSDQILNAALLAVTVVVGILLIRSVDKEVQAREQIESLADDLSKANARLKELDKLKSEFVSIASHQLRSPLTAIKGYASLMLEGSFGKVPKKLAEPLQRIFESSKSMALSVEDFLNVSRIEQGKMKYEMSDFDMHEMVSEVVEELRPVIEQKGLAITVRQDSGKHVVCADPGKIKQVVSNLIDNSLKYTPKGSITVSVDSDREGQRILTSISDTGVGMSKETIGKLFDKFTRAKNANTVNVMGTGLGLYVAKQMVEAHKGRIVASSAGEGKGSTFTIELPAKQ